jgi:DNA gyrase/topoisomerase IV subunit A
MPKIKTSEYSKIVQAHSNASSNLKGISETNHLPQALKDEVKALMQKFKDYDLEQHRETAKMLTGSVMTAEELQQIVVDATGYTKWKLSSDFEEDDAQQDHTHLLKHYGVDVADKRAIKMYRFTRNSNSRSDLWLISFTCFPGHAYISFDTGRVGWDAQGIVPNKDIESTVAANCDN